MFTDFLLEIVASATVSATLTGMLLWLTKSWVSERIKNSIKNEYDEKLETHKAKLNAKTDIELEKLKSNLSILAVEHQVKFANLHAARAEVVAETYALLKDLYTCVSEYVKVFELNGEKPREERRKLAIDAHNKFREFYPKKIIYLPKLTANKVSDIDKKLTGLFNEFSWTVDFDKTSSHAEKWYKIFDAINGETQDTLHELEDEFRRLLGEPS